MRVLLDQEAVGLDRFQVVRVGGEDAPHFLIEFSYSCERHGRFAIGRIKAIDLAEGVNDLPILCLAALALGLGFKRGAPPLGMIESRDGSLTPGRRDGAERKGGPCQETGREQDPCQPFS